MAVDHVLLVDPAEPDPVLDALPDPQDLDVGLPTGRYVGFMPESLMHFGAMRSAFKVLPVDFPVTARTAAIVTLRNRTLNPAAQLFIKCAREVVKPLVKKAESSHSSSGARV